MSAGNGLSGGGTIEATRTITLDTGSVHFLDGVKKELNTEGVISGSSQVLGGTTIHSGSFFNGITVVSGSAQVSFNGIVDKPTLVSGSSQISYPSLSNIPGGIVSGSSQISFNGITDKPTLVSGSSQITYGSLTGIPSGIVSGSAQVSFGSITGIPSGLVSGSSQITYGSLSGIPSGIISGSSQVSFGSISGVPSGLVSGSSQITLTSGQITTGLGFTPYNSTNPNGYTTNTGTVTSVSGTGTVSGLSLSGTVTSTGNLTLGGTLTLTSGNVTTALGFTPYNATNPNGYISSYTETSTLANVVSRGNTANNKIIINSTGTGGDATLKINTSTSATFVHSQENLAANLTAGQHNILVVGRTANTKNSGYIGYYWAGDASNSNFVTIGHWGNDDLFRVYGDGTVTPGGNGTQNLGTSSLRWNTVFTSDLSMSNGIGDYTIVEGEEDLFIYNNKTNKVFKFLLQEVDPSIAPAKKVH